jgi:hypothetical protein
MPSPVPGSIFHPERLRRARPQGSLVYAHSDLSALPLIEEAQYRGVAAARHVLRLLAQVRHESVRGWSKSFRISSGYR